ncbi:unnamed protein product [Acanthoscelides obtectus]|uniref:Uncharacterized protein n=1 Tax=Acanthoscelides obtectus TaxID=200917 RepID=A0A9P0KWQ5_ACAOB|nr:unnamed protein product [Acanthoscelides obtectus]CAK1676319.1 hypothetical protein AOBTE_LOCUS30690 [Acanthoscelides obtectus]
MPLLTHSCYSTKFRKLDTLPHNLKAKNKFVQCHLYHFTMYLYASC